MRKATAKGPAGLCDKKISIPAFREEGDGAELPISTGFMISIPAFREEGDIQREKLTQEVEISIPAFREEGDLVVLVVLHPGEFQSPPSVRKATNYLRRG